MIRSWRDRFVGPLLALLACAGVATTAPAQTRPTNTPRPTKTPRGSTPGATPTVTPEPPRSTRTIRPTFTLTPTATIPPAQAIQFRAASRFAAGMQPIALAVGDFDGDGKTDLVVLDAGESAIRILPGKGTGAFLGRVPPLRFQISPWPSPPGTSTAMACSTSR